LALRAFPSLPKHIYLGVNASPVTILSDGFASLFDDLPIVIELTEHAAVDDYGSLGMAIDKLRRRGIRLAIDDAGAGYSGLQHILKLRPDLIKLDLALTRNIDTDVTRRALASALVNFAGATDCKIIAEGVETEFELQCLKDLGVQNAQGYYLGRPSPLSDAQCIASYGRPATSVKRQPVEEARQARGSLSSEAFVKCEREYGRPGAA